MNLPQIPGYEFETLLGEGGCGAAYRCRFEGGGYRTVKILNGMAVNPGLLSHALTTVSNLPQHPNLTPVHTYNLGQTPYYYATDYYGLPQSGRPATVHARAGKLRPNQAWNLIEQLCAALAFLHKYDVIHTSIKPGNVFVAEDDESGLRLRLGDVGQGLVAGLHYFELNDSGFFCSPEQLTDGDFSHGKGKRWDVYSFGVLSFYILTGQLPRLQQRYGEYLRSNRDEGGSPLRQEDPLDYFHGIQREARYGWPHSPKNEYEAKLRSVVDRCLRLDPAERPVDLREVARDFETIRHNADLELLAKQHRAQLRGKTIKIRTLVGTTGIFLVSSVLLLISAMIGFSRHMTAVAEISEAEKRRVADLNKQRALFDEKVTREVSLRQAAQQDAALKADRAARLQDDLKRTKAYTDRFFAALLSAEDIDVPGFQKLRREEMAQALPHFETFRKKYDDHPEFLPEVARAHQFLGEIKFAQGRLSDATSDLREAGHAMDSLLQDGEVGLDFLEETALIERSLAEIEILRGNSQRARDSLDRSSQRFQRLLTQNHQPARTRLELMINRYQQAQLDIADSQYEDALKTLDEIVDAMVRYREKNPDDLTAKSYLGRSFVGIGKLARRQKNEKLAREMFGRASEQFAELIQAEASVEDHQYYLALCLNQLGELDGEAAILLDAHKLLDRVVRLNPNNHRYRFQLAKSYGELAGIQRRETAMDQAKEMNRRSLKLVEDLVREEPEISTYRYLLAKQNLEQARILGDHENFKEAAAKVDQSIRMFEDLLRRERDNERYLTTLAKAQGHAGYVRKALGDKDEAKDHFRAAKETWTLLLEQFPEDHEAEAGLAWIEDQLTRA